MEIRNDGSYSRRVMSVAPTGFFMATGLVAIVAMSVYLTVRAVLVVLADYRGSEIPVSIALLLAEGFILVHAFGYMISIFRALRPRKPIPAAVLADPGDFPDVDVLVPARHESRKTLERTLSALVGMHYPKARIWLLDDSSEPEYIRLADTLVQEFGIKVFRREQRHGAKAGIINDCLKQLEGKYVAVFDADQCPMPFFLNRIVPLLEADKDMAFVQTPQFYSNINANRVARAAGCQQAVFYEYICEAKSSSGSAFCCGTNVVFRREALEAVGGLDENSVTEDFATSIKLHGKGWKSLYYGQAFTMGLGPETLSAYFRQQFRWARGTLGVGIQLFKQFLRHPTGLRPMQWLDYGLSGTFYLVGWAYLILMICPMLYILFGIPSYFVRPEVYALAFLPYILFSIIVFCGGLYRRHYSLGQLVQGQLLGVLAAPIHVMASIAALTGRKSAFGITPKGDSRIITLKQLWPQIAICSFNYFVFIWGLCRFWFERDAAALINALWVGIHFLIYWSIFYFRDSVPVSAEAPELASKRLEVTPA